MSRSLSKEMRLATREVHKLSDALVNAKLAFALNNNDVWCDGILVFYEIFKFLEENVSQQILPLEYHRAEAFEKDIQFYKGNEWQKTYKIRPAVQTYLNHLYEINERNSLLLIAYVYHLYMGLLSGGQILTKKRKLAKKFKFSEQRDDDEVVEPGQHLTSFPNKSVLELKNNLRSTIDDFCKDFDDKLRNELIEESKKVFKGVGAQLRKNLRNLLLCVIFVVLCGYLFVKMTLD